MSSTREPGATLRAALEERGCALSAHEARALAESLIGLICAGLVVPAEAAVHSGAGRPSPSGQLGQAPCGQAHSKTAPAHNMGQSVCIEDDSR